MENQREVIVALIEQLEQERSYTCCVELACALGYEVSGEAGETWVDIPGEPLNALYFSVEAFIEDVLRNARQLVGN